MLASELISQACNVPKQQVEKSIGLFAEGATLPFIARYRKEATGGLSETELREIQIKYSYYEQLETRKKSVLVAIKDLGKLSPDLHKRIQTCFDKRLLEDLYAPYKKSRKSKADVAIEKGYLPLAELILAQTDKRSKAEILAGYASEALEGARHIVAQTVANMTCHRQWLRKKIAQQAMITSKRSKKDKDEKTKFDMYADFSEPIKRAASHRILAIRRGENEKYLSWKLLLDEDKSKAYLKHQIVKNKAFALAGDLELAIDDAYKRLLFPALENECFAAKSTEAEDDAIAVFAKNLEQLLMKAPAGEHVVMGVDPGFRTGCKLAVLDKTGGFLEGATIFPTPPKEDLARASQKVLDLIHRHKIAFIAIGNGTASKETLSFFKTVLAKLDHKPVAVIVSEAGASVYSASSLAVAEYPDLDVTIRGAISIGQRLQDPLAALVKIEPKAIGVGQYQHDVNQKQLKEALDFTIQWAVNQVGVDVNTASASLLSYVSGIGPVLAQNICAYRQKQGAFRDRNTLLKVPKLGPKVFQQCAGFLRIKSARNPLDQSAIHPESYTVVTKLAKAIGVSVGDLIGGHEKLEHLVVANFVTDTCGEATLQDIIKELKKPGLDPRDSFAYADFDAAIDDISDLELGMTLEGVVTNVTNFGAFVDIGVHQDGLIHISNLSDNFVKHPQDVIALGEAVKVKVLEVDQDRKRIQLVRVIS
eukprot:COSAG01_NODE_313_length_19043_cov_3.917177_17_plen_704_part_00